MTKEEEAIRELSRDIKLENDFTDDYINAVKEAVKALEQISRTGHWIRVDKNKVRCSACEVVHLIAQYPNGKIDWCPNCGAKMIKTQESEDKNIRRNCYEVQKEACNY